MRALSFSNSFPVCCADQEATSGGFGELDSEKGCPNVEASAPWQVSGEGGGAAAFGRHWEYFRRRISERNS